ncbi:MAG: FAD:protein FMN transferase [Blastocatellia bacterium]|nr:FAD:protein FMN transferase [Blastocatellia bacterium]
MATRFELVMEGEDGVRLRAAGEEALAEIERVEAQLSFYRSDSEVRGLNLRAGEGAVRVDPRLFRLLRRCAELTQETAGAFDVTVGPLMRAWRFVNAKGQAPTARELAEARAATGIAQLEFEEETCAVRFARPGVEIDLGGYGKGYAVERAMDLLREAGVARALLNGGGSSVAAIGAGPGWRVALREPFIAGAEPICIDLRESALSVSAVHGKSFTVEGRTYGHVIDPRSGWPVRGALAAAVEGPSASECEALSKALLVLGPDWLDEMRARFPAYAGLVACEDGRLVRSPVNPDAPAAAPPR